MTRKWWALACILKFTAGQTAMVSANPGHEISIADLNLRLQETPDDASLYFQRAWNYAEIQQIDKARADWEKVLELMPGHLPASRELARCDALQGDRVAGIARLRKAMEQAPATENFHLAGCHALLAELLLDEGKPEAALHEAKTGLQLAGMDQLDLVLLRSEAQRRLGLWQERVKDLSQSLSRIRSFVLKIKWYDAMIDAGDGLEILDQIEEELGQTRYRASWLIRRARIRLYQSGQEKPADDAGPSVGKALLQAASADLEAAMEEIRLRLRSSNPDLSLICERGIIRVLQGNHPAARADLHTAVRLGADRWMTGSLMALLEDADGDQRSLK